MTDEKNPPLNELRKNDLVEIAKFAQRFYSFKNDQICKRLGYKSDEVYTLYKEYFGKYHKHSVCVALPEFLKSKGAKIDYLCNMSDGGFISIRYEDIPVGLDKFEKVLTYGVLFVTVDGVKFAIELDDELRHDRFFEVVMHFHLNDDEFVKKFAKELEDFALANSFFKGSKIDPELNFIRLSQSFTWNDVILPTAEKEEIIKNVNTLMDSIDIYRANKINFKRGLILKGEPGTGKTLIGKILCSTVPCTFLWVTPKNLELSKQVSYICNLARDLSPTVLFLEDIDLYGENRDHNANASLLGEFMNQLDGIVENSYVIVIATTNKPEKLEKALKNRPGRFDRLIDVPPPDREGRKRMLEIYVKPYILEGVEIDKIAEITEGYTGSHMKELVSTAAIDAIDEKSLDENNRIILKAKHFSKNISKVRNKKIEPTLGFSSGTTNKKENDWD